MNKITLRELAKLLNCDYRGEELAVVNSVASLDEANDPLKTPEPRTALAPAE